jgi:hypothetical protein
VKSFRNTVSEFNAKPENWKEIYREALDRIEKKKEYSKINTK